MYEFDSVSVSSFEAAELAATLTTRSTEGWDVVAIVPAGSEVVAYLRRSTAAEAGAGAMTMDDTATDSATSDSATAVSEPDTTPSAADLLAADATTSSSAPPTDSTTATDSKDSTDSTSTGWAATGDAASGSGWGTSDTTGSWGGSSQQSPVASPAQTTPSVPAGWYADPAGRFELRYWDGGAWTEHVSRAGQQYTDPPVA